MQQFFCEMRAKTTAAVVSGSLCTSLFLPRFFSHVLCDLTGWRECDHLKVAKMRCRLNFRARLLADCCGTFSGCRAISGIYTRTHCSYCVFLCPTDKYSSVGCHVIFQSICNGYGKQSLHLGQKHLTQCNRMRDRLIMIELTVITLRYCQLCRRSATWGLPKLPVSSEKKPSST